MGRMTRSRYSNIMPWFADFPERMVYLPQDLERHGSLGIGLDTMLGPLLLGRGRCCKRPHANISAQRPWKQRIRLPGFDFEDIQVKVKDREVFVHARHEENTGSDVSFYEVRKAVPIPADVDADKLSCFLKDDGLLELTAPRHEGDTDKDLTEKKRKENGLGRKTAPETDVGTDLEQDSKSNDEPGTGGDNPCQSEQPMDSSQSEQPVEVPENDHMGSVVIDMQEEEDRTDPTRGRPNDETEDAERKTGETLTKQNEDKNDKKSENMLVISEKATSDGGVAVKNDTTELQEAANRTDPTRGQQTIADVTEIVNTEDGKEFHANVNMGHFEPKDITIRVRGNTIYLDGVKEVKKDGLFLSQEVHKRFSIPGAVNRQSSKASVSDTGVVKLVIPFISHGDTKETNIPIEFEQ